MNDNLYKVIEIDINEVLPNRFQPRIQFDEEEILELSDSIKEHGVIQPLVVRTIGDKYEIIAGERRYKASVLAGKETVPVIIKNLNDKDSAEVALIENIQRKNLTPIEEALSYKKILDMGYLTQESLAIKLGKSQSSVANKIRLLNLSDEVQEALLDNKISERHARSLLRLKSVNDQNRLLSRIMEERLTVRRTDEEIDKMLNNLLEEEKEEGDREMNNSIDQIPNVVMPQTGNSFDIFASVEPTMEPISPVSPVVPTMEPVTPVAPVVPTMEPISPVSPVVPTMEPVTPVDPVEPIMEPISPVAPVVPTMEPISPVAQIVPTMEPETPVAPVEPTMEPETPVAPIVPTMEPEIPVAPVEPMMEPVTPVSPVEPTMEPVTPVAPVVPTMEPVTPAAPVEPMMEPVTPVSPVEPTMEPEIPVAPVEPMMEPITPVVPPFGGIQFDGEGNVISVGESFKEPSMEIPQISPIMESNDVVTVDPKLEEVTPVTQVDQPTEPTTISETSIIQPIIVTDYNKQYDPVMPESRPVIASKVDFKEIVSAIRECSKKIEKYGYKIDVDEYDLSTLYQVVFKIEK